MIYLLASILCSVSVSVLLKIARKQKIDIEQAVAVNYIVAVALTMWVLQPDLHQPQQFLPTWWIFAALGVLLPGVFIIMGRAVEQVGIVKSDAAQRLSLFLPILASFLIFGETLTEGRLIGIVLAFAALLCLLWKADTAKKGGTLTQQAGLLLGVWAGYGVIDILFKQLAKSGTAFSGNLLVAFCLAAVLMFGWLFAKGSKWRPESIIGGAVLGGLNFLNILTYIRAHQTLSENPSIVFAGMNMGVIVLGTLIGAGFFKEKISSINAAGISMALVAVVCLFYWETLRSWVS
ncbi:DMT family transporter [Neisseria sp. ZJ106]|uniref:DMT family transporter n=1 Tax=Neisseria lisongii TaxID=2912188 RepID=A0ABY7RN88_9NEIS|nr:DMT family transporter [Neisseria lisongii]MCF7521683.1 DMT family transporter [Neisseria lisongii]WCL72231.1 DMT family transporter [Neisseria lisongii]